MVIIISLIKNDKNNNNHNENNNTNDNVSSHVCLLIVIANSKNEN